MAVQNPVADPLPEDSKEKERKRRRRMLGVLTAKHGNRLWDWLLRSTGILALLGIPLVLLAPATGPLVAFVLVTIWVNGPLASFLPATYETILLLYGRLYPPLVLATLGIAGTLLVEFLNYQLLRAVLDLRGFERMREIRIARRMMRWYRRAPFLTVWVFSWSPLPYWFVRVLSPMADYPVERHLLATLLGRFPRFWFFAALGMWWAIKTSTLATIIGGSALVGFVIWLWRRRRSPRPDRGSEMSGVEGPSILR